MSSCVGLVYFQSLLGLRLLLVIYLYGLGVNGEKINNVSWDIINKNGHSTFGKPGNFNILREVISIIL